MLPSSLCLRMLLLGVNLACQSKFDDAKRVLEAASDIDNEKPAIWIVLGNMSIIILYIGSL